MKTIEDCKQEIACRFAHPDWDAVLTSLRDKESTNEMVDYVINSLLELHFDSNINPAIKLMINATKAINELKG